MHILFATSEIAPFANPGELADHCAVLSDALRTYRPGKFMEPDPERSETATLLIPSPLEEISVITPLYRELDKDDLRLARRLTPLKVPTDQGEAQVVVYEGRTPQRVRVFFLEHSLFDTEKVFNGNSDRRFAFFSRAVVEFCRAFPLPVDIVHCHGWTTALIPVYLDAYGQNGPLEEVLTVFSTHDLSSQGSFDFARRSELGLPEEYFEDDSLENDGQLNFAKGGILFADMITTPSESSIRALGTSEGKVLNFGLDEVLTEREDDLVGVLSGVDYEAWDPSSDAFLAVPYDLEHLNGKRRNKADVQHIFGLPRRPMIPLMGFLSPLEENKGIEILLDAVSQLLDEKTHAQFIFMTDGQSAYKKRLVELAARFPKAIGLHFGDDSALQHRALAGIDMILLPSRVEHSTHLQLRAMRYGTVPIARNTGALRDTIDSWDGVGKGPKGKGAGIIFEEFSADALADAIDQAIETLNKPTMWRPILQHCMKVDFSWGQVAHRYVELYKDLLELD